MIRLFTFLFILIWLINLAYAKPRLDYFISVDSTNYLFLMPEKIEGNRFELTEIPYSHRMPIYKAGQAGFFKDKTILGNNVYTFVSPIPSIHSDRSDHNWYRTQFDTDTVSNCGPSIISMAIGWAKGKYIPVSLIRNQLGFNEAILGATGFDELIRVARTHNLDVKKVPYPTIDQIYDYILHDHILGVVYNTGEVSYNPNGQNDLIGRPFPDEVGHYNIIKGITKDKKYIIVNDPIPSNWWNNSFRHADGISMLGQNRYYPAEEFLKAIKSNRPMLLFSRQSKSKSAEELDYHKHASNVLSSLRNQVRQENAFYKLCNASGAIKAETKHTIDVLLNYLEVDNCLEGYQKALLQTELKLEKTDLSDLTPLAGFPNLISLTLGGNHFSNLEPIASLEHLQSLTLWGSQIEDISPLASLQKLKRLFFWGKFTHDLTALNSLQQLEKIEIWGTNIESTDSLLLLPNLKDLQSNGKRILLPRYFRNLTY